MTNTASDEKSHAYIIYVRHHLKRYVYRGFRISCISFCLNIYREWVYWTISCMPKTINFISFHIKWSLSFSPLHSISPLPVLPSRLVSVGIRYVHLFVRPFSLTRSRYPFKFPFTRLQTNTNTYKFSADLFFPVPLLQKWIQLSVYNWHEGCGPERHSTFVPYHNSRSDVSAVD